jgi:uncharacterized membrane protein YccC
MSNLLHRIIGGFLLLCGLGFFFYVKLSLYPDNEWFAMSLACIGSLATALGIVGGIALIISGDE